MEMYFSVFGGNESVKRTKRNISSEGYEPQMKTSRCDKENTPIIKRNNISFDTFF